MSHKLNCRMEKHGCPWKGPRGKLEEHLTECPFVDINCNECGKQLQRKDLGEHVVNDCPIRIVPCKYCTGSVVLSVLELHYQACLKYPLQCDSCGRENIPREKMKEHLEKECPTVAVNCPFSTIAGCPFMGLQSEIAKHVQQELPSHTVDMGKRQQQEMRQVIGGLFNRIHDLEQQVEEQRVTHRCTRVAMESLYQEQCRQGRCLNEMSVRNVYQQNEIDEIKNSLSGLTHVLEEIRHTCRAQVAVSPAVQELTQRVNKVEKTLQEFQGRVCNGSYIWKIENYLQCCQDAINTYGPPFQTSLCGYKMCLRISLNDRHVGLFVHMMQGDHDNILVWPLTGRITLTILDQSGAESANHISRTFQATPNLEVFQRPISPLTHAGYGYEEFATIQQICEPWYVKNNTILVKCEFHPF